MTDELIWEVRGGAMQEDGLHGIDGYDVWRGDERADDSFFQDSDDAQEMADRLNTEECLSRYYIEVEDDTVEPMVARVFDLWVPGEPCVAGPMQYREARAWVVAHGGDPHET